MFKKLAFIAVTLAVAGTIAATSGAGSAARGKYLVCPLLLEKKNKTLKKGPKGPEPDTSPLLSGHPDQMGALTAVPPRGPWLWAGAATNTAFSGPWGIS